MVNRIVTGAHYGLRDWLAQRITAVVMAAYILFFAAYLLLPSVAINYDSWLALFTNNVVRSFTFLFMLCVFYHAWIGMRDIVMDYVKPAGVRLVLHVAVILALILYAIWSVQILWGL